MKCIVCRALLSWIKICHTVLAHSEHDFILSPNSGISWLSICSFPSRYSHIYMHRVHIALYICKASLCWPWPILHSCSELCAWRITVCQASIISTALLPSAKIAIVANACATDLTSASHVAFMAVSTPAAGGLCYVLTIWPRGHCHFEPWKEYGSYWLTPVSSSFKVFKGVEKLLRDHVFYHVCRSR
ncbi:hypothetical protein B0H21DRAFT_433840 [Amylocystis lapponica]|nr:hypothetical protein B0H21DRAFT_433840 [Amylocystis lapponica]